MTDLAFEMIRIVFFFVAVGVGVSATIFIIVLTFFYLDRGRDFIEERDKKMARARKRFKEESRKMITGKQND